MLSILLTIYLFSLNFIFSINCKDNLRFLQDNCSPIFNFSEKCITININTRFLDSIKEVLPQDVYTPFSSAVSNFMANASPRICYGDYTSKAIKTSSSLDTPTCNSFPLDSTDDTTTFGVVSASSAAPCGVQIVEPLSLCSIFDRCDTFALAINGRMLQCAVQIFSGGMVVNGLEKVKTLYLGYSRNKRFTYNFQIPQIANQDAQYTYTTTQITTKGNYLLGLGISLPITSITIKGYTIADIITSDNNFSLLIDYQDDSTIQDFKDYLQGQNKTAVVENILSKAQSVTTRYNGQFTLKLDTLSLGFLNDFSLNAIDAFMLISNGVSNGVNKGIYIYVTSDMVNNLMEVFTQISNHYSDILNYLGVTIPTSSNNSLKLAIIITEELASFKFDFSDNNYSVECVYIQTQTRGSCKFGTTYFAVNGVMNQITNLWYLYTAKSLTDSTGSLITRIDLGAGQFKNSMTKNFQTLTDELNKAKNLVTNIPTEIEQKLKNYQVMKKFW